MRRSSFTILLALLAAVVLTPVASRAQYFYLDLDGNGLHDPCEALTVSGQNTVGIWLDPLRNRDGSPAFCPDASYSPDVNSYEFILRASGGSVTWGTFTDRSGSSTVIVSPSSNSTEFFAAQGSPGSLGGGPIHLADVTVTVNSSTPVVLSFAETTDLSPVYHTGFGSPCPSVDFDNTMELGRDFFDADGTNGPPVVTAPPTAETDESMPLAFDVSFTDPESDPVDIHVMDQPLGSIFPQGLNATPTTKGFQWTPADGQAGEYTVTFTATDPCGNIGSASTQITVHNVNHAPIADPGGPYSGCTKLELTLDGSQSHDPDGDQLTNWTWDFGDGSDPVSGPGLSMIHHTYQDPGTYTVTLIVSDGSLDSAPATTTIEIGPAKKAAVLLCEDKSNNANAINLNASSWDNKKFEIEPVNGSFTVEQIILSTVEMTFLPDGATQVVSIHPNAKGLVKADCDKSGVFGADVEFSKDNLKTLFASLSKNGTHDVTVTVKGNLTTGCRFEVTVTLKVKQDPGPPLAGNLGARIAPNPFNPDATIRFQTNRRGPVQIALYDATGRLVRVVLEVGSYPAGEHAVRLSGAGGDSPLATGVYYYRITSADGPASGRFVVLK